MKNTTTPALIPQDFVEHIIDRIADRVAEKLAARPVQTPAEWLDPGETAVELGIHRKTVLHLIRKGELAATKHGRIIRVRRADIDAFLSGAR